ncbi:MAG: response regulator transcription factor [Ignavibacteriales bacterium]|nr:response regulator transcription factor [Ignavibacteriales bacterium]
MVKSILVVDDETDIVELLSYNLKKEGYNILSATNGKEALLQAESKPDLILLDVMMPQLDGFEVIKQLRKNPATENIPVIFLTAKSSEFDEVVGLELGADDYIIKPISIPKLLARIKSVLRKHEQPKIETKSNAITYGVIEIFLEQHKVFVNKKDVFFPKKEFQLLQYLIEHAGTVIMRDKLLDKIWGNEVRVNDRTIDVHIRKIREKLCEFADCIETIKGIGYRMKELK